MDKQLLSFLQIAHSIKSKYHRKEDGFTLLELSVAVGILLILSTAGMASYASVRKDSVDSATQSAALTVYDKVMAYALDNDSKTDPMKVADEYNSSSNAKPGEQNITVSVEPLGNDRFKVVSSYNNGENIAERITPMSGDGDSGPVDPGEGGEVIPPEVIGENKITKATLMCDSTTTVRLPFAGISPDATILIEDSNGNYESVGIDENQKLSEDLTKNLSEPYTLNAGVEYEVTIEGNLEYVASVAALEDYQDNVASSAACARGYSLIADGVTNINLMGLYVEDVPAKLPKSVVSLEHALYGTTLSPQGLENLKKWDVSNVKNMNSTFQFSNIDVDLSDWNVSNVTSMNGTFKNTTSFNNGGQPLEWDTRNVNSMDEMFRGSKAFNQPIIGDKSNVVNMSSMFEQSEKFNQNISDWNTEKAEDMSRMFAFSKVFNNGDSYSDAGSRPLSIDTSNVQNMNNMFYSNSVFNQNVSALQTGNVVDMGGMFFLASKFNNGDAPGVSNSPLNWDTRNVKIMSSLFANTVFNQYIGDWNTSNVEKMNVMFNGNKYFNNGQAAGQSGAPMNWDVSKVNSIIQMFFGATAFNQNLSSWKFNVAYTSSFDTGLLNTWDKAHRPSFA